HVLLVVGFRQRGIHFGARFIDDVVVGELEPAYPVGDHGDLDASDLVAIPARHLISRRRRGGMRRGICAEPAERQGGAGGAGAGKQSTARQKRHCVPPNAPRYCQSRRSPGMLSRFNASPKWDVVEAQTNPSGSGKSTARQTTRVRMEEPPDWVSRR